MVSFQKKLKSFKMIEIYLNRFGFYADSESDTSFNKDFVFLHEKEAVDSFKKP